MTLPNIDNSGLICPFILPLSADPVDIQLGDQIQQLWNMIANGPAGKFVPLINKINNINQIEVINGLSTFMSLRKLAFPVEVIKDGGFEGSPSSSAATLTYTVNDILGHPMALILGATNQAMTMTPEYARPANVALTEATEGTAYYTKNGHLVLNDVDENVKYPPRFGTITAHSQISPTQWAYTGSTYTGSVTLTPLRNLMEPVNGSPGPLGITVSSAGSTNGGCIVKPIGVGAGVLIMQDPTVVGGWAFSMANSAE